MTMALRPIICSACWLFWWSWTLHGIWWPEIQYAVNNRQYYPGLSNWPCHIYVVTAADLRTAFPYSLILKYADDIGLHISSYQLATCNEEPRSYKTSNSGQLKLNLAKTSEIIITTKGKSKFLQPLPPLLADIVRVARLKILRVTVSDKLSISEHVQQIVSRCTQSLHALRILRSYGMEDNVL